LAQLQLKAAFSPNPRIQPLVDGEVRIPGVEIEWTFGNPGNLHLMHMTDNAFDVFEFSISNFSITRQQPAQRERLRWAAIPIFLSKAFMWRRIAVNVQAGIGSLADLKGKRVGVPDFQMTAAVWMRIVMRELYGIQAQDVDWFNGRTAEQSHGEGVHEALASGIRLRQATSLGQLSRMLQSGELDAAYGAEQNVEVEDHPNIRPLFGKGDFPRVVGEFRQKTGATPTNHTVVVQQALIDRHPELAMDLYNAFEQSKQRAYERARQAAPAYFLFPDQPFARQGQIFGDDPFPSGVSANRAMLELLFSCSVAEGLLPSKPEPASLFHESTRAT